MNWTLNPQSFWCITCCIAYGKTQLGCKRIRCSEPFNLCEPYWAWYGWGQMGYGKPHSKYYCHCIVFPQKSHYIVNMLVWCDRALFCFWYNALNLCTSPFHHVNLSSMKRFSLSSSKSIEYVLCPATAPSASLAAILRSKGNSTPAFLSHSLLTFSSLQSHTTGSDPRP